MEKDIKKYIKEALTTLYSVDVHDFNVQVEKTKDGIEGNYTIVVFPFVKFSKKKPLETAKDLGVYIKSRCEDIASYNVVGGFLNLSMSQEYWINRLNELSSGKKSNTSENKKSSIMIEFSSPNTNKPLHLGHVRNNLLGDSISRILEKNGNNIIKVNLINDRGIHICKSMLAWMKWGNGATPESTGIKGDKFVGDYYVLFEKKYREEIKELMDKGINEDEAKNKAPVILEAREILRKWEAGDLEIRKVWETMNSWVYAGFDITYKSLNISFDKLYYESQTYLLGRDIVNKGLEKGIFVKDADGSVWIDLTDEGLDRKILLRSDGTTVYITQDIGTAYQRFEEFYPDKLIYVVGNEQDYHFKVLKNILQKLNKDYSERIEHLSYGMVELPEGKMKSREGIVVDADDLIDEMTITARNIAKENGRVNELPEEEKEAAIKKIALGALKYYILKVDPKKQMIFNPKESIDFNGNTGPFIQYTYARICSVLRNAEKMKIKFNGKVSAETDLVDLEIDLVSILSDFENIIADAANKLNPGIIANYIYDLVKLYNQYYHEHTILKEQDIKTLQFRLLLSLQVSETIKQGMYLLGIEVPEVM
ncbi:MAG: arginine--tRNA ligase [Bacteroidales bacterium]|jgi:arginyl-tRNA synthetase|nr:arginine--tRNA ligase [Bacteroidales bacterium]